MTASPILVHNVSRSFDGPPVLDHLSFAVEPGSIYGFLGRNGSGKTTTIRMLAGLIKPAAGEVRILGHDPFTLGATARQELGYMSEKAMLPPYTTVGRALKLGRTLYSTWDSSLAETLLAKYNLSKKKRFITLSQGNQRLLSFIMAIAPRPRVLLLDEPAANLDVVARREILDDILELIRDCGSTVLFSTHVLGDVERVADKIGILARGKLRIDESLDSLKDAIRQVRFYGFSAATPADEIPESLRTVRTRNEITVTLRTTSEITPETLADRWSCQHESRTLNLEDIFVELSRHEGSA
jgi:ABC-2 type transport system ATP-binding protein